MDSLRWFMNVYDALMNVYDGFEIVFVDLR